MSGRQSLCGWVPCPHSPHPRAPHAPGRTASSRVSQDGPGPLSHFLGAPNTAGDSDLPGRAAICLRWCGCVTLHERQSHITRLCSSPRGIPQVAGVPGSCVRAREDLNPPSSVTLGELVTPLCLSPVPPRRRHPGATPGVAVRVQGAVHEPGRQEPFDRSWPMARMIPVHRPQQPTPREAGLPGMHATQSVKEAAPGLPEEQGGHCPHIKPPARPPHLCWS